MKLTILLAFLVVCVACPNIVEANPMAGGVGYFTCIKMCLGGIPGLVGAIACPIVCTTFLVIPS